MIDYSQHFDAIYCLSLADFVRRRNDMHWELKRVGIEDSGILHWKITVRNAFYKYIYKNPDFPVEDWWTHLQGCMNCTMGHYEIMMECLARGFKRVLIIEDDIRFLKDIGEIETHLRNLPEYDICMWDKNIPWEKEPFHNAVRESKVNDYYIDFTNVKLNSTGCYAVNAKAMEYITASQMILFNPSDKVLNELQFDDDLKRVASIKNVAIQNLPKYKEKLSATDRIIYESFVDYNDYEL